MAKTVGSNFFLMNRRLSASFKKGGFDALAAEAGAASATSRPLSNSYWLETVDKIRTYFRNEENGNWAVHLAVDYL